MRNRVGTLVVLVGILLAVVGVQSGAWAAGGGPALFVQTEGGATVLYHFPSGRSYDAASGNTGVEISPDGRLLAATDGRSARYVVPGGAATVLDDGDAGSGLRYTGRELAWGPGSDEFAFTRVSVAPWGRLFVADVIENRVVGVSDDVNGFEFAPNARMIAATVGDGLVVYDLETGGSDTIVDDDRLGAWDTFSDPSWSPSGDAIVYRYGSPRYSLRIVDPDTGLVTELAAGDPVDGGIGPGAWSTDGSRIAYVGSHWDAAIGSVGELIVVDREGRSRVLLSLDPWQSVDDFVWTGPSTIAYTVGNEVRQVDEAGEVVTLIATSNRVEGLSFTSDVDMAWLPLVAAPRATDDACPAGQAPAAGFGDVGPTNAHRRSIDCVVWWKVAQGTTSSTYEPAGPVTRAQMATFIARTIRGAGGSLPEQPPAAFADVSGSTHERSINELAAAEIVSGRSADTYGPDQPVTRAQMATFLVRTHGYLTGTPLPEARGDYFADVQQDTHRSQINRAAEAGLAAGITTQQYNPSGNVRRDQMASFLARLLDLLAEELEVAPPGRL